MCPAGSARSEALAPGVALAFHAPTFPAACVSPGTPVAAHGTAETPHCQLWANGHGVFRGAHTQSPAGAACRTFICQQLRRHLQRQQVPGHIRALLQALELGQQIVQHWVHCRLDASAQRGLEGVPVAWRRRCQHGEATPSEAADALLALGHLELEDGEERHDARATFLFAFVPDVLLLAVVQLGADIAQHLQQSLGRFFVQRNEGQAHAEGRLVEPVLDQLQLCHADLTSSSQHPFPAGVTGPRLVLCPPATAGVSAWPRLEAAEAQRNEQQRDRQPHSRHLLDDRLDVDVFAQCARCSAGVQAPLQEAQKGGNASTGWHPHHRLQCGRSRKTQVEHSEINALRGGWAPAPSLHASHAFHASARIAKPVS